MKNKKLKNEEKDYLKDNINEINDKDILNTIIFCEKTLGNNYSSMLSEMSNTKLYKEIEDIFLDIKYAAHESYVLAFENGWYSLEESSVSKINETSKKAEQMKNE